MHSLVTTDWLAAELGADDLAILDSSAFLPNSGRDPAAEFLSAHIPGARFLDIESVSDRSNPAPHMLPTAAAFGAAMEALGVGRDQRIIVYDNSPIRTAVRGWFMLRHFGARQVAILDGGMQKWLAEGRALESGQARPSPARFLSEERSGEVVAKADVARLSVPLVDARSAARFNGSDPDPRPGVARGHIPGSRSLPLARLYNADGTFRSPDALHAVFAEAGVDPLKPFVATCGSGVTANALIFAAHLLGNTQVRLYDGSWSEWGADPATPKATGPA